MSDDLTLTANGGAPPVGTVIRAPVISSKTYQTIAVALLNSAGTAFNGWETGNEELAALLASAARTVATNTPNRSSPSHRGVMLFLNTTANGGGATTLSLKIQAVDPVSSSNIDIADFGVVVTAANGAYACLLYPGAIDADFAGVKALSVNLPTTWRAVVTPSTADSWTYSLGAVGLR